MNRRSLFTGTLMIIATSVFAQEFSVNEIPDSLQKNANVVKRYEETVLEIKSAGKFTLHNRVVYTILNEEGNDFASFRSGYDNFTTIDYASGKLFDKAGNEIKHVKKKDMPDDAYADGISLMQDDRYISNDFAFRSYPYTVDYEEDQTNDGVLSFPDWTPVEYPNESVQYSKYVIVAPSDYQVRYNQLNFSLPPVITEKNGRQTYTWEIRNLRANGYEVLAPSRINLLPYMMVAPSDFEAQGYSGNMSTWKNFGEFIYQLKKGRDILPDEVRKKVHELTDDIKDPRQKIKVLYDYLQNNTHYISIQLGIGGWQPFDATYVATKKYGDCKALSNFMIALLKEAGISGKYVLIKAGEDALPVIIDFSKPQFNHVICCVPLQNDTVWLECTDQTIPEGYLSGFTSNRWGLLVDENGGRLVRTPNYNYKENQKIRNIHACVNNDGDLSAVVSTEYKVMQQDNLEGILSAFSNDKAAEYLKSTIDLPTFEVNNIKFREIKNELPVIISNLDLIATNYAEISGKRLFLNPNILSKSNDRLTENEDRKYDVVLREKHTDIDSVEIQIPAGYTVESPFHDTKIDSKFGTFIAFANVTESKIIYFRKQEFFSATFPAKDYAELVNYYDMVYKTDHAKIVLVKKE